METTRGDVLRGLRRHIAAWERRVEHLLATQAPKAHPQAVRELGDRLETARIKAARAGRASTARFPHAVRACAAALVELEQSWNAVVLQLARKQASTRPEALLRTSD